MTILPFNNVTPAYDADDVGMFLNYLGGYVTPADLDELEVVTSANNGEVLVEPGTAICYTTYYISDSNVAVAIGSAVNNRIDRVVLRYDSVNKVTRVTKIVGVEAANPSPPAFTTGDVPLAWVWIPAGFNAATTTVSSNNIHDERVFRDNATSRVYDSHKNLIENSEFIAFSGATAGAEAPEKWRAYGTPTAITAVAALNSQPRGLSAHITGDAGDGMQTTFRTPGGVILENYIVIKGVINITAGNVRITAGGSVVKDFFRTGVDQEFIMHLRGFATNSISLVIEANAGGSDFTVGQIMAFNGFIPGNFRPFNELLMLDYVITDANWNATAKSTGTTNIDLSASFGNQISRYARGVVVRIRGNDSASGANACGIQLYHQANTTNPISRLYLDRLTNDRISEVVGYVPLDRPPNNSFTVGVTATGAGTLDATLVIIGILT